MDNWSYNKRPLKLHELLEEIENIDVSQLPNSIVIFPPTNANDYNTDEDSGDENEVNINNLPGSQLTAEVEIIENANITFGGDDDADVIIDSNEDFESEDDLDLGSFQNSQKSNNPTRPPSHKKKKRYSWKKKDIESNFPKWQDVYLPQNNLTPLQLFFMFFDQSLIEMITNYSNTYASQRNRNGNISVDEMKCFIGVLLLSGYNVFPRRAMYWENADDAANKLVYSSISRDRFNFIMQNLHCNNNDQLAASDKFSKMRPLLSALNNKFISLAPTEDCHSLDESMVPYYGGHGSKQFIRGKPIRWGYKFRTGTTKRGYIEWFEPYQGASTQLPNQYKLLGLGASVVLQFAEVLQSQTRGLPFHIFFDNFFISLPLLEELTIRGLRGTGTMRENRMSGCPIQHSKIFKKQARGSFEYALVEDENIMVCKWNDNNVVTIASNVISPLPTCPVKRYSQKEKKHVHIEQPHIIKKYNEFMGGVDRADQNISLYRISIRGKKWYFSIFSHCLDMAVQNAWQLHRCQGGTMDHLCFKRCIARGLLETFKKSTKRGSSKRGALVHSESRFDRLDHLVVYQDRQTRCAVCHKQAAFRCKKCDIALHPKICFSKYHVPDA